MIRSRWGSGMIVAVGLLFSGAASGQRSYLELERAVRHPSVPNPPNLPDSAADLVVDTALLAGPNPTYGHVWVTGQETIAQGSSVFRTIRYLPDGSVAASARWPAAGQPAGVYVPVAIAHVREDVTNYVYVTGQAPGVGTGQDYITIKYDALTLAEVWSSPARYNHSLVNGDDIPAAMSVIWLGGSGSLCVTGRSTGGAPAGFDYATARFCTSTGQLMWPTAANPLAGRYNGSGQDTAVDVLVRSSSGESPSCTGYPGGGQLYVTGTSYSAVSGSNDIVTLWLDDATGLGNPSWPDVGDGVGVRRFDNGQSGEDRAAAMTQYSGNIYVTGASLTPTALGFQSFGPSPPDSDLVTLCYAQSGSLFWTHYYDGGAYGPDAGVAIDAIKVGTTDELISVTGTVRHPTEGNNIATLQYGALSSDPFRWVRQIDGAPGAAASDDHAAALKFAPYPQGDFAVYATGRFRSAPSGNNYDCIAFGYEYSSPSVMEPERIDPDDYAGPGGGFDAPSAIGIVAEELWKVYICGRSLGVSSGDDFILAKFRRIFLP